MENCHILVLHPVCRLGTAHFFLKLCFMKIVPVHAIKVCGGMELQLQSPLTFAVDVGEWSASFPRSFTSGENAQVTDRTGDQVNPEPVRTLWKRKNLLPLLGIKAQFLDFPASSLVAVLAKLCSVKLKHYLYRPGHALSVPGGCDCHISRQHMKVVRLSAIHTSCLYPQETSLVIISVRGLIDPRATAHLEGLCQWKIPVTLLGIELMTFVL